MKHNNWFWGVFFVLAAVLVIASQLTDFAQIGFWSIAATVLLAAVFIQSLIKLNYFGIFLPLALGYLIYAQPLDLPEFSTWLLILTAVLFSIGFHSIFRKHPKVKSHCNSRYGKDEYHTIEDIDDNNPFAKVSFGASSKYLHAPALKTGQFSCNFGALEIFFDQVQPNPDGAEIFLDCSFGSISLYIPKSWKIIDNLTTSLGSVQNDMRLSRPDEHAPKVTLNGSVSLGSIEIHYI